MQLMHGVDRWEMLNTRTCRENLDDLFGFFYCDIETSNNCLGARAGAMRKVVLVTPPMLPS